MSLKIKVKSMLEKHSEQFVLDKLGSDKSISKSELMKVIKLLREEKK